MATYGEYLRLVQAQTNRTNGVNVTETQVNRQSNANATAASKPINFSNATGGVGDSASFSSSSQRTVQEIQVEIEELTQQKDLNTSNAVLMYLLT